MLTYESLDPETIIYILSSHPALPSILRTPTDSDSDIPFDPPTHFTVKHRNGNTASCMESTQAPPHFAAAGPDSACPLALAKR